MHLCFLFFFFFFFNDTATTEIYTLSLHDALPISPPICRSKPTNLELPDSRTVVRLEPIRTHVRFCDRLRADWVEQFERSAMRPRILLKKQQQVSQPDRV